MIAWGLLQLCCTGNATCVKAWVRIQVCFLKIKRKKAACHYLSFLWTWDTMSKTSSILQVLADTSAFVVLRYNCITFTLCLFHTPMELRPLCGRSPWFVFLPDKNVDTSMLGLNSAEDELTNVFCWFSLIIRLKTYTLVLVHYVQRFGNPVFIVVFLFHFLWTFSQDLI